ncbi:MAG: hypothetical protein AAFN30_04525 [Actinomycetota bacterium]
MRLAAEDDRIHAAGAEVIAISVDEVARQAGVRARWKLDHQLLVADPGGADYLRPLDLYDPEARGGIAVPGVLVIAPDGTEVYRYRGRDFADRTTDAEMLAALEGLGLPAVEAPAGGPEATVPGDLKGFFTPEMLGPYYRGNMFGATAIGGRVADPEATAVAEQHRAMAKATLDAWDEVKARS